MVGWQRAPIAGLMLITKPGTDGALGSVSRCCVASFRSICSNALDRGLGSANGRLANMRTGGLTLDSLGSGIGPQLAHARSLHALFHREIVYLTK